MILCRKGAKRPRKICIVQCPATEGRNTSDSPRKASIICLEPADKIVLRIQREIQREILVAGVRQQHYRPEGGDPEFVFLDRPVALTGSLLGHHTVCSPVG